MKSVTVLILMLALASAATGEELPSSPRPVEHDPGAWAFTTGFTSTITGTFMKPWIGLAAGVTIGVAANLQQQQCPARHVERLRRGGRWLPAHQDGLGFHG